MQNFQFASLFKQTCEIQTRLRKRQNSQNTKFDTRIYSTLPERNEQVTKTDINDPNNNSNNIKQQPTRLSTLPSQPGADVHTQIRRDIRICCLCCCCCCAACVAVAGCCCRHGRRHFNRSGSNNNNNNRNGQPRDSTIGWASYVDQLRRM